MSQPSPFRVAVQLAFHSLYTKDLEHALRVSKKLESSMVGVKCTSPTGCRDLPFGGWKSSGLGGESLLESLAEYMEVKVFISGAQDCESMMSRTEHEDSSI